tara:strand:- start:29 stop:604 length:576 start_codon:yes stop_codon:yes gene_type:complete
MKNANINREPKKKNSENQTGGVCPKNLKNKALNYLSKYASTEEKLRQILAKYCKRKWPQATIQDSAEHIKETVKWCTKNGYVNDYDYMIMKINSGRLKGQSATLIKQKLLQAGLTKNIVLKAFTEDENHFENEFKAALVLAKKKRIGPFSLKPTNDKSERRRQIARLARAGFNYEICKNVFDYSIESKANL